MNLVEQVRRAYALSTSERYIACACSDGIVRIFLQGSLEYSATFPRPAPYGYHGLTDANVGAYLAVGNRVTAGTKFPDAIACTFVQQGQNIGKTSAHAENSSCRSYHSTCTSNEDVPHKLMIYCLIVKVDKIIVSSIVVEYF